MNSEELKDKRYPSADEFVRYFKNNKLKEKERQMLSINYYYPNHTTTSKLISVAMGWKEGGSNANLPYGKLAGRIASGMGFPLPDPKYKVSFLVEFLGGVSGLQWKMRPELAEAIRLLDLEDGSKSIDFGGIEDPREPDAFEEGGAKYRKVLQYERSVKARQECINVNGCGCAVCGISFGEKYGVDFEGLVVVHHLRPMAEGVKRETDPARDLKPLCPNCHAMAHFGLPGDKPRPLDELKRIIQKGMGE